MILIKLLNMDNFYAESDSIEIAKGKYKLPETITEGITQLTREYKWIRKAI